MSTCVNAICHDIQTALITPCLMSKASLIMEKRLQEIDSQAMAPLDQSPEVVRPNGLEPSLVLPN
jgi:hypothetical protein